MDGLSGRDGPPMMRMFIIQGAFEFLSKIGRLGQRGKIITVLMISLGFMVNDFN